MEIQKATEKDLGQIQTLNQMLFEKEYNEYDKTLNTNWTFGKVGTEYFRDSISNDNSLVLVVKDNEKIIGYLVGSIKKINNNYRNIEKQAELENMFILREYRNMGIGKKLVERLNQWAKKNGADNISVVVASNNKEAKEFYRKCGFDDYEIILEMNLVA